MEKDIERQLRKEENRKRLEEQLVLEETLLKRDGEQRTDRRTP